MENTTITDGTPLSRLSNFPTVSNTRVQRVYITCDICIYIIIFLFTCLTGSRTVTAFSGVTTVQPPDRL